MKLSKPDGLTSPLYCFIVVFFLYHVFYSNVCANFVCTYRPDISFIFWISWSSRLSSFRCLIRTIASQQSFHRIILCFNYFTFPRTVAPQLILTRCLLFMFNNTHEFLSSLFLLFLRRVYKRIFSLECLRDDIALQIHLSTWRHHATMTSSRLQRRRGTGCISWYINIRRTTVTSNTACHW